MRDDQAPVRIAPRGLRRRIEALGAIGRQPDGGVTRLVYDAAWAEARRTLARWMRAASLDVREDAVGNLFGRLRGTRDDTTPILTGSHIDTVPHGGMFDGALGVLAGLEALRALRRRYGPPLRSLELVALCEEEGSRFPAHFWGSRGMLGLIAAEEMETLRDAEGITIGQAMRAAGLAPERFREAVRHDIAACIELHIEQGGILAREGVDAGIVEAITGLMALEVTVEGMADHAGTTPMDARRDALQGAAHMALAITAIAREMGAPAVATVGRIEVWPGAANVVPGRARFSVDLRHPNEAAKQRLGERIRHRCEAIAREQGLALACVTTQDVPPTRMDAALRQALIAAAEAQGATWRSMPSGAGHDSQVIGRHVPAAMLFVPSVDGRSHSPAEHTRPEDAARGAAILAGALHRLAYATAEEAPGTRASSGESGAENRPPASRPA